MRTPDQLDSRLDELSFELMFHKYLYFEYDRPAISDRIYDSLKEEYRKIATQLGYPISDFSPCLGYAHGHPLAQKVAKAAKFYLGFYV